MQQTVTLLKALADPNRFRIFWALTRHGELCACQITELLQVTGATVSRHLGLLSGSGLITSRKDGKWVLYQLNRSFKDMAGLLSWLGPRLSESGRIQDDLDRLEAIVRQSREEICRKQRGGSPCPIEPKEVKNGP